MRKLINQVAVLGSGVMGAGIAAHIANAGISVCLLDIIPNELTEEEVKLGLTHDSPEFRNRIANDAKSKILNPRSKTIYDKSLGGLIKTGNFEDDMEMVSQSDWIIEVVIERLDIKRALFKKVDKYRKKDAIISTNTSGISINEIISELPVEFREQFIGVHFFNPPRYMKLVELIPSNDCKSEIKEFMKEFVERTLGKTAILCKDTPAFIANRIGTFASIAGLQMIEKSKFNMFELDTITGPVMGRPKTGTFRLMDVVGLDIPIFVAQNIIDNIDDLTEKEAFAVPQVLRDLVEIGHLGDKTKQGFYKRVKTETGNKVLMWDEAAKDYVETSGDTLPAVEAAMKCKTLDEKLNTLLYSEEEDGKVAWEITKAILLYSARKAEEITYSFIDIDTAMECGYNWEYGPFRIWDAIGLEKSVDKMKSEGEVIPEWIENKIASGNVKFINERKDTIYIGVDLPEFEIVKENNDAVIYNIGDDVLCLKFKTKANSIEEGVSEMLLEAVELVETGYNGLVLANDGKNFSVGANLSSPTGYIKDLDFNEVENRIGTLQKANMAMKYCKRPIVSAPFGMTLGGGAEIVLHTASSVAAGETYMGLVEIGIGLVPAGGGIKEMLFRYYDYCKMAPKANVNDFVQAAWDYVAMGKVSGNAIEAIKWGFLKPASKVVMGQEYLIEAAKKEVLQLSDDYRAPVPVSIKATGAPGRAAIEYTSTNMQKGDFITEYDGYLAEKVAFVLTGGDAAPGALITEENILQLEKEAFMSLLAEEKTQRRIEYMLKTGKRLSN